jgi:hypothetical protein
MNRGSSYFGTREFQVQQSFQLVTHALVSFQTWDAGGGSQ